MNHTALISEAKEKMLQENPLRRNEALVNQIVEWQNTYYFPFLFASPASYQLKSLNSMKQIKKD